MDILYGGIIGFCVGVILHGWTSAHESAKSEAHPTVYVGDDIFPESAYVDKTKPHRPPPIGKPASSLDAPVPPGRIELKLWE